MPAHRATCRHHGKTEAQRVTWGSILIFLLTRGGGPLSLDRLVGLEPTQTYKEEGESHAQSRA